MNKNSNLKCFKKELNMDEKNERWNKLNNLSNQFVQKIQFKLFKKD